MKKIVCLFFILTASLSNGAVIISCQDLGNHVVQLSYDASGESSLVRAFALNVGVSSGVFLSIDNYFVGESTAGNSGYGIFPGSIILNPDGTIPDWGSPLANPEDPGALGGIGTRGMTLEFGSLYYGEENAPQLSGILCTFTVSQDCIVSITPENVYRGGIVLEDGTQPEVICNGCQVVPEPTTMCIIGLGSLLLRKRK
jgi:hypothetical protein